MRRVVSRVAMSSAIAAATVLAGSPPAHAVDAYEANAAELPFASHEDMVFDARNDHLFVSGGDSVVVADVNGNIIKVIDGEKGASGLAISDDGTELYVGLSSARAIAVIDTKKLKEVQRYKVGSSYCPRDVALSLGKIWFSHQCGSYDIDGGFSSIEPIAQPVVKRWATNVGPLVPRIVASSQWPHRLLATNWSQSEPLSIYNLDTFNGEPRRQATAYDAPWYVRDLALTSDSQRVVLAAGDSQGVYNSWTLNRLHNYMSAAHPHAVAVGSRDRVAAGVDPSPYSAPDIYVYEDGATSPTWTYDFGRSPGAQDDVPLAPRGLAWGEENNRLYAITTEPGSNPTLHSLVPSTFSWTELSLNYEGPCCDVYEDPTGVEVQLAGQLTPTTGITPGEQTIRITRHDSMGDEQLPDTRTAADGTYTFTDTIRTPGLVTYTATFDGTTDLGSSQDSLSFDLSSP